jgi:exo-beta-1,3-glucanase (GH17 family)
MPFWFPRHLSARRPGRHFRPQLEALEDRTLPSAPTPAGAPADLPASPVAQSPSTPQLLVDLATNRGFIDYSPSGVPPSGPFNPGVADASPAQIQNDLAQLQKEGWTGIVTYSMEGNQQLVPSFAKNSYGFQDVIVGISNSTVARWDPGANGGAGGWSGGTTPQEYQNALNPANLKYIDGIVVGNEGLTFGPVKYSLPQLQGVMKQTEQDLQKAGATRVLVTTTEPTYQYLPGGPNQAQMLQMGDWLFPNADHYNGSPGNPHGNMNEALTTVGNEYYGILNQLKGTPNAHKLVVVKESFWPHFIGTTDVSADQLAFFQSLSGRVVQGDLGPSHVYFCWGEAYDQYWKNEGNGLGPYWGYHTTITSPTTPQRTPEPIVQPSGGLRAIYTAKYPAPPPNFPLTGGGGSLSSSAGGASPSTGSTPTSGGGSTNVFQARHQERVQSVSTFQRDSAAEWAAFVGGDQPLSQTLAAILDDIRGVLFALLFPATPL